MKKILATAVLAAAALNATAREVWVSKTESGGEIVITAEKSTHCEDSLRSMYLVMSTGEVVYGCWAMIDERIHVRYDNGVRRAYTLSGFEKRGTADEAPKNNRQM